MINMDKLRLMPESALRELNYAVVEVLKHKISTRVALAAREFSPGQLACFVDRRRGCSVTIRVTRTNQKSVSGYELDRPSVKWRVPPAMLSHITS